MFQVLLPLFYTALNFFTNRQIAARKASALPLESTGTSSASGKNFQLIMANAIDTIAMVCDRLLCRRSSNLFARLCVWVCVCVYMCVMCKYVYKCALKRKGENSEWSKVELGRKSHTANVATSIAFQCISFNCQKTDWQSTVSGILRRMSSRGREEGRNFIPTNTAIN